MRPRLAGDVSSEAARERFVVVSPDGVEPTPLPFFGVDTLADEEEWVLELCLKDNWMTDLYDGGTMKKSFMIELILLVIFNIKCFNLFSSLFCSSGLSVAIAFFKGWM